MFKLSDHPFPVQAFFESSLVLSFAVPQEQVRSLVPAVLELDTLHDRFAFVAMAIVKTRDLRPGGWPVMFGSDFILIGYRVFVRYTNKKGKRLRGLYILRSETDSLRMKWMGNLFTHYRYQKIDIRYETAQQHFSIQSKKAGIHITGTTADDQAGLPAGSPFADWKEARRFAGPLPFTFSVDNHTGRVLVVEGVRENWTPSPVHVDTWSSRFIDSLPFARPILANAFIITDIPYQWKKGAVDQ